MGQPCLSLLGQKRLASQDHHWYSNTLCFEQELAKAAGQLNAMGPGTCTAIVADLGTVKVYDMCSIWMSLTTGNAVVFAQNCEKLANELPIKELHVLVNNSGVSWGEPLEKFQVCNCSCKQLQICRSHFAHVAQEKGWDRVMDVNVKSIFFLTQALIPKLLAAGMETFVSLMVRLI